MGTFPITEEPNQFQYFDGSNDFDVNSHVSSVRSLDVVRVGGLDQEALRHVPQTSHSVRVTLAAVASSALTGMDAVKRINVREVVNYVRLSPSALGNPVIVSLRPIEFILINGVYYAIGDFIAQGAQGTAMYRVPAQPNYEIQVFSVPPVGYTAGYTDYAMVGYGFLPDSNTRVAV